MALNVRNSPAKSKCTWRPPGLKSNDVFAMMSGARLGVFGLFTPVALLVLPLLLSNSWKLLAVEVRFAGSVTELGRVCSGFSMATPIAQLFVGCTITRKEGWRAQVRPSK